MHVISFASTKGGAGKTSSAITLGTALARNHKVVMIDADPAHHLLNWANNKPEAIEHMNVWAQTGESGLLDAIDRAKTLADYILIDTEGAANRLNSCVMTESDLVVIPMAETPGERRGAKETAERVVLESRITRRPIPFTILFNRVDYRTRGKLEKRIRAEMEEEFSCFDAELRFRTAYNYVQDAGGTLWDVPRGEGGDITAAIENAELAAINLKHMVDWVKEQTSQTAG